MPTNVTKIELRKTGISVLGDMPWGTHLCHFYETNQDLLDAMIPYFKAGLESNDYCLWVISDPLTKEEARSALRQAVPDFDRQLADRRVEIVSHREWYLNGGRFNLQRVIQGWDAKLKAALARGFVGMRVSGNTSWLQQEDWRSFREYEMQLEQLLAGRCMIVLCTYHLAATQASQLLDVARIHQSAVACRCGQWEVVETPAIKQAKQQIEKLNDELERKVEERTTELATTNERLNREIEDRKSAEAALLQREEYLRVLLKNVPVAVYTCNREGLIEYYNPKAVEMWGRAPAIRDSMQRYCGSFALYHTDGTPMPFEENIMAQVIRTDVPQYNQEVVIGRPDGTRVIALVNVAPLMNERGEPIGAVNCVLDITARKQAEEQLELYTHALQTLSCRLFDVQEDERRHLARELHDDIGQLLTATKIALQSVQQSPASAASAALLAQGVASLDSLLDQVRRLSLDLRPPLLDDLGLVPALRWYLDQTAKRSGLEIRFVAPENADRLDPKIETACFRVVQEALTNVLRHARARSVTVELQRTESLIVCVRDDGIGFDVEAVLGHARGGATLGLLGMRERVSLLGGRVDFQSVPGEGTELRASFPLVKPPQ